MIVNTTLRIRGKQAIHQDTEITPQSLRTIKAIVKLLRKPLLIATLLLLLILLFSVNIRLELIDLLSYLFILIGVSSLKYSQDV